mmetsp:Transcript_38551/g.109017  ORF Transcript_38551/g.109017 Transcript_38551/m.109017 type:complete len:276 (+) Transcript_38551:260-1087(+)
MQQQQQPMPAPVEQASLLSSLLSHGILKLPTSAPPPSSSGLPVGLPQPAPAELNSESPVEPMTFNSNAFESLQLDMVSALLESSDNLRPKHLDLKFQRKRRVRTNQTASRAWFVPGDIWVAGGAAQSDAAPSVFFNQEEAQESAVQQSFSVPADETQTNCAISGEKFEEYFDEVKQEWRYRDAKRLTGAEAQKYGVADGSVVLVSCLSSASVLDSELGTLVTVTDDMQQVEHELSEATEQVAGAGGGAAAKRAPEGVAGGAGDDNTAKKAKIEDV